MPSIQSLFIEKMIKLSVKRMAKKGIRKTGMGERRQRFNEFGAKLGKLPKGCMRESCKIGGLYSEWLSFADTKDDKVILYLHGGAYEYGSADTHRVLAARIGKASGTKVLLPEYRLAPEHPFPAAVEDAVLVYHWLLERGYKSSNIIFAGDSAGAGLSMAAVLKLREQNDPLPAAVICLSPWADLTSSGESYEKNRKLDPYLNPEAVRKAAAMYAGDKPLNHPMISPVFADLTDFPPLFIQSGSHEILQSDAEMLAAKARLAGVDVTLKIWEGMWHVWQIFGGVLPEARKAIREIGHFAKRSFKNSTIK